MQVTAASIYAQPLPHADLPSNNAIDQTTEQLNDTCSDDNSQVVSTLNKMDELLKRYKTEISKDTYCGEVTYASKDTVYTIYQGQWQYGKWHGKEGKLILIGIGIFSGKFDKGKFLEGTATYDDNTTKQGKFKEWKYIPLHGTMQLTCQVEDEDPLTIDLKTRVKKIGNKIIFDTQKTTYEMRVSLEDGTGQGKIAYKQGGAIYQTYEGDLKYDKETGKITRHGKGTITTQDAFIKRDAAFVNDQEVKI